MNTKRSPSRLSSSNQTFVSSPTSPTPPTNEQFQQKYITKWSPTDVSSFILGINDIPVEKGKELSDFILKKDIDGKKLLRTKPEDLRKAGINIKWCRIAMEALEAEKKKRVLAKAARSQSRAGAHSPIGSASLCSEDDTRSIFSECDNEVGLMSYEPVEAIHTLDVPNSTSNPSQLTPVLPDPLLTPYAHLPDHFSEIIEKAIQEKLEWQRTEFNQLINERLIEQKTSLETILHTSTHKEHDALHEKLHQSFEEHQHCMKTTMQQQMSDYEQILREQTEDTLESQKFVLERIIACKVEELKGLVSKESKHNGMDKWEEVVTTIENWKLEIQELKKGLLEGKENSNGPVIWSRYLGFFLSGLATGSILGMLFFKYSR
ncbi:hypothetical protein K7432_013643 [Basidiobolus ranarum]|uniref:SAM domain-containing protein n=1 Tax=Basidiobolus ranarum TaxID=34480 RepID=A0ABR2VQP9_9FUNG